MIAIIICSNVFYQSTYLILDYIPIHIELLFYILLMITEVIRSFCCYSSSKACLFAFTQNYLSLASWFLSSLDSDLTYYIYSSIIYVLFFSIDHSAL